MKTKPASASFDAKLEQARQLLDAGRIREALDLALEALQEEISSLHAYFQALGEKMGHEPRPPVQPREDSAPPGSRKPHLH